MMAVILGIGLFGKFNVALLINVNRITRNQPCRIMSQERPCGADVFDAHEAARRSLGLGPFQQFVEFGNAGRRTGLERPRRMSVGVFIWYTRASFPEHGRVFRDVR